MLHREFRRTHRTCHDRAPGPGSLVVSLRWTLPTRPVWLWHRVVQLDCRESAIPIVRVAGVTHPRRIMERKFDVIDAHSQQDGLGHLESDRAARSVGRSRLRSHAAPAQAGLRHRGPAARRGFCHPQPLRELSPPDERAELEEYVRVNNELMILQSKARLSLQKPRLKAKR